MKEYPHREHYQRADHREPRKRHRRQRRDEPALHLLEPRNDCADDNLDQLFRVEQARPGRYRFRSAGGTTCVGLRGGAVREGAEAIREPCADEPDQEFTVDLTRSER